LIRENYSRFYDAPKAVWKYKELETQQKISCQVTDAHQSSLLRLKVVVQLE
jgi:hypothetical protein